MAGNVSTINVTLEVDDKGSVKLRQFAGESQRAGKTGAQGMDRFGSATQAANARLAKMVATVVSVAAAVAAIRKLNAAMQEAVRLAGVQEAAEAKVAAVLRSTGEAAGYNLTQLKEMAAGLQMVTTYGDETTLSAMALLLTFKQVREQEFSRTIAAAQDMATVMDGDLNSAVLQLGKALNDPVANLGALSRAGVQFTDNQKSVINALWAAGDAAGAQKVILTELESQFGGAAAAVAGPFGGAVTQSTNDLGDLKEEIGFVITKNQFFIDLVKLAGSYFREWSAYIAANREELSLMARNGIMAIVSGLGTAVEVMRFFHNGWLGIKLVGQGAVIAIIESIRFLQAALRKVSLPLDLIFKGLVKIGTIAENPFDTMQGALDDVAWSSRSVGAQIIEDIEKTNAAYDTTGAVIRRLKADMESLGTGAAAPAPVLPSAGGGNANGGVDNAAIDTELTSFFGAMDQAQIDRRLELQADFNAKYAELGQSRYDLEREQLAEMVAAYEAAGVHKEQLAQWNSVRLTEITREETTARLALYQGVVGGIASTFQQIAQAGGKQSTAAFRMYQATAMAEAAIGGASAYIKMLSEPLLPYPSNVIMAGVVAGLAGAKMGMIAAAQPPSYDQGGISNARGIYQTGNIEEAHIPLRGGKVPVSLDRAGTTAPPVVNQKIINVLDPGIIGDYLATDAGERLVVNMMARNREALAG